jgi:ABC-type multidrug transport system fused ATPase/permease subunit
MKKDRLNGQSVPLSSILADLESQDKVKLYLAVSLRVAANFLDLAALAGVAFLAISISGFGRQGGSQVAPIPWLTQIKPDASTSIAVAGFVALLFLGKSALAIQFNLWLGKFVAGLEVKAGRELLKRTFGEGAFETRNLRTLPEIQNALVNSLNSLFSNSLLSAVALLSELTLLVLLLIGFLVVNPLATMFLAIYLLLVVFFLNQFVSNRIKGEASIGYQAHQMVFTQTRDLFSINREANLAGLTNSWIKQISDSQSRHSMSLVRAMHYSGLPRYIVESALILGVFGFIGGVVIFSDLPTQAVTLGIFLTGGLRLTASILPLQTAWNTLKQSSVVGLAAFQALTELRNQTQVEHMVGQAPEEPSEPFSLEVDGVYLMDKDRRDILKDITFQIPAGTKCAIVGPSGAGKTTLLEVVLGLRTPSQGKVLMATTGEAWTIETSKGFIGYVPQKPALISGTFRQNITLDPELDVDDKYIEMILELTELEKVAKELPDGLGTMLDPDSGTLSGGEIQRIGLARALYRKPRLLVLDESTSALDAVTEDVITRFLDSRTHEMTTIIVAHRLSTIQNSEKIIYLDGGRVLDEGTFSELIERQDSFASAARLMSILDE